eukprot:729969-Prorocentrum_minimum.AAC.1
MRTALEIRTVDHLGDMTDVWALAMTTRRCARFRFERMYICLVASDSLLLALVYTNNALTIAGDGEGYEHAGDAVVDLGALAVEGECSDTMASSAGVVGIPVRILVGKAERAKCGRCWRYTVEAAAEEAGGD